MWEVLYQQMLNAYVSTISASSFTESLHDLLNKQGESSTEILKQVEHLINQSGHYEKFLSFIKTYSEQDDTWKFWAKFVLQDCIAYIGLYLAIRCNKLELKSSQSQDDGPSLHSL